MAQWAFVIMPTHCVNDTDSLQQLPPLPQTSQPIPPSQPLVGRNPLKEICRGGSASLFQPEHVLGILQSFLTLTKDSTLLWKKYFMSQMSHKFRSQTYSWINDTQTERKTVWRAESSCSAVELNSKAFASKALLVVRLFLNTRYLKTAAYQRVPLKRTVLL